MANETWNVADHPRGSKTFESKWVFKTKLKTEGVIDTFKARLVVQGFN